MSDTVVVTVPFIGTPDSCSGMRHVFKETNYFIRGGRSVPCRCGKMVLRLYGYQTITQSEDPLILQDFEVQIATEGEHVEQ